MSPVRSAVTTDRGRRVAVAVRDTLLFFIPLAALATAILALVAAQDRADALQRIQERQEVSVEATRRILARTVSGVIPDLLILANSEAVRRFVEDPGPETRARVIAYLELFSRQKGLYDQVRLIDSRGQEVVRVDASPTGPRVVPEPELQDKSGRYYFTEAMKLRRGSVYVSPLDLNIENLEVELPHKPMMRFATPVEEEGGRWGVLVLNYYGAEVIDTFREALAGTRCDPMLLDPEGWWLAGPDPHEEWGAALPGRRRFVEVYPEAARVLAEEEGQLLVDAGLFTFTTVRPLEQVRRLASVPVVGEVAIQTDLGDARAYTWKVIAFMPRDRLEAIIDAETRDYSLLLGLSLAFIGVLSVGFAQLRETRREAAEVHRLSTRVMEVTLDGVSISDGDRRIVSINHAFSAITGHTPGDVTGRPSAFILAHADPALIAEQDRALEEQGRWEGEVEYRRRDGEVFPALTRISALKDRRGHLTHVVEMFTDITDRKLAEQHLERLARQDALTGLANRNLFTDRVQMAVAGAHRRGEIMGLLYIDLDGFKPINDRLGHEAGDMVLREVGRRLTLHTRENDTVARLGGDEFAVVLQDLEDVEAGEAIAEALRQAVEVPIPLPEGEVRVGASLGLAFYPRDGHDPEALVRTADAAMYRDKRLRKPLPRPEAHPPHH